MQFELLLAMAFLFGAAMVFCFWITDARHHARAIEEKDRIIEQREDEIEYLADRMEELGTLYGKLKTRVRTMKRHIDNGDFWKL